jgi:hypothetical protein
VDGLPGYIDRDKGERDKRDRKIKEEALRQSSKL